ncbi:hypothetical protein FOE78_22405 [Microlunatus elymi]|uniref:DUF4386 family protein n=1 Tax=Microlunatus elymi TaxID=2596828 RepID=A0A516Q4Z0_9ACTN|nr:hypothetical protein [Microlunatus elymi]QDP98291.1 hypothetical protein FOE78_22405 [Microlunatus elymi]
MPQQTWRIIGAITLLIGLASLIITTPMQWALTAGGGDPARVAATHPDAWTVMGLFAVLGPAVWIIGVLTVARSANGRGWLLSTIGGLIASLALACGVGHLAVYFTLLGDLTGAGLQQSTIRAVLSADGANPISTTLLLVFLAGFTIGPVLLSVGLRRAGLVPVWLPVAAVIAGVANFAGGPVAGSIQLVMLIATYLPMARVLQRANPESTTTRAGSADDNRLRV